MAIAKSVDGTMSTSVRVATEGNSNSKIGGCGESVSSIQKCADGVQLPA